MWNKNIITFDLENWYDSGFVFEKSSKDFVLEGADRVLKILNKHKTKATFFVSGEVIEKYPELIKKLHYENHEIASHSYRHVMLNKLTRKDIEKDIKLSARLIKKVTGSTPLGFRAPIWSISKKEFWIYELLERLGFKYSSSLFPINMGFYGSYKFPKFSFKPIHKKSFIELPITPFSLGIFRVPFSGGIYFRLIHKKFIEFFIKRINRKNRPIVLYLHPWEFCSLPRIKSSFVGRFITYYGLKSSEKKLDYILSKFKFFPIREVIKKLEQYSIN